MEKRDKFYMTMIGGLILVVLFLAWRVGRNNNKFEDAANELKKSIIDSDSLKKEADGRYAKLVDYFNTEKDLKNELKSSNEELYKVIKKQNERILSLTNAVITLQGQISEGIGHIDPLDTNKINLALKYPNDGSPFINWIGNVDRKTAYYKGEWSFGRLPLQVILTEEKRGIWKSRLVGPEWLIVDSMTVNSLPPEEFSLTTPRKIQFLVGGGYYKSLSATGPDAISVGFGLNLFDKHNIIVNTNTNKEVGFNYYYKFQSFKRRK